MDEKLLKKYLRKMQKCVDGYDTEADHSNADGLLCDLLTELGYEKLVAKYREVDKWYS